MESLISEWELEFLKSKRPIFPDLWDFENLLAAAAPAANIAKIRPGKWWKTISRINERNPKLGILAVLDALVARCLKVPVEPVHAVWVSSTSENTHPNDSLRLGAMMLESFPRAFHCREPGRDEDVFFALRPFTSPEFQKILLPRKNERELDRAELLSQVQPLPLFAALMDIHQQQSEWWAAFGTAHSFARSLALWPHPQVPALKKIYPSLIIHDFTPPSAARKKRSYRRKKKIAAKKFSKNLDARP